MTRRWCLLTLAGLALLAAFALPGEPKALVASLSEAGRSLRDSLTNSAYAAPRSRGSVIRLAPPKYRTPDENEPGVIASDRGMPSQISSEVQPVSGVQPRPARHSSLDGFESMLPDDEPEELVAGRPLPPRPVAKNSPFVSRRPARSEVPEGLPVEPPQKPSTPPAPTRGTPTLAPALTEPTDDREPRIDSREFRNEELVVPEVSAGDSLPPRELPSEAPLSAPADEPVPQRHVPLDASSISEPSSSEPPCSESTHSEPASENPLPPLEEPRYEPAPPRGTSTSTSAALDGRDESPFDKESHATGSAAQRGVMLRWQTPAEVQVDTEGECQLLVENTTDSKLVNITVRAELPAGLRLVRTEPSAGQAEGQVGWEYEALEPHEQRVIHLWVVPTGEGEIEPKATVTFSHASAARLNVIHPRLTIEANGPASTLAGQPAALRIRVTNPGTGKARNVAVTLRLDQRLHHQGGDELRYAIGSLASGQSRDVQVALNPVDAGVFQVHASVTAEPGLSEETEYNLEVIKPSLQVVVEGPRLRYVDRQATYSIKVHNPGPAPADNVQVFDDVPMGFRFVDASAGGTFDAEARQVAWFVGRLEPNQTTEVNVQLVATEPGEQRISAEVKADAGVSETAEAVTRVEGVASVALDVVDADDPVEVAGETTYEIRLTNRGSRPALGVQAAAKLPTELEPIEATGPTHGTIQGQQVVFEPLDSLAPGQSQAYQVRVRCKREGQITFRAYFRDAEHTNAIVEEELTRVYQD